MQMQSEGHSPSPVTLICILNACEYTGEINKGKQLHNEILSRGLLNDNILLTILVEISMPNVLSLQSDKKCLRSMLLDTRFPGML